MLGLLTLVLMVPRAAAQTPDSCLPRSTGCPGREPARWEPSSEVRSYAVYAGLGALLPWPRESWGGELAGVADPKPGLTAACGADFLLGRHLSLGPSLRYASLRGGPFDPTLHMAELAAAFKGRIPLGALFELRLGFGAGATYVDATYNGASDLPDFAVGLDLSALAELAIHLSRGPKRWSVVLAARSWMNLSVVNEIDWWPLSVIAAGIELED